MLQQAFESSTDVLLLQEPYVAQDRHKGIFIFISHPSFHTVSSQPIPITNRPAQRPRTLMYIRKSSGLQFSPRYDMCNDLDMQIVEVNIQLEPFLIINIYNERQRLHTDPTTDSTASTAPRVTLYTVDRLLLSLKLGTPAVIAGDFNLHHPRWNAAADPSKISKAKALIAWLDKHKAELIIDAEEINRHGGTLVRENLRATSVIDLAFTIRFRKTYWRHWHFLPATGSDHEAIAFEAEVQGVSSTQPESTLPAGFNHKKADWNRFTKAMQEEVKHLRIPDNITSGSMDALAQALTAAITTAAEEAMPRLRHCERSKPWWNKELWALRIALNRELRAYKKLRSEKSLTKWRKARNHYFRAIRQAKTTHWEAFLANAAGMSRSARRVSAEQSAGWRWCCKDQ